MTTHILYACLAPASCEPEPEDTAEFLEVFWPGIRDYMQACCPRDVALRAGSAGPRTPEDLRK